MADSIADAVFQGYIAHEYSPAQGNDPLKSLEEAMQRMRNPLRFQSRLLLDSVFQLGEFRKQFALILGRFGTQ